MDEEAVCPICYESCSDATRTLSCRHAFCHDCLVGTFVSSNYYGVFTRDTIICPVCRHVTFVTKGRSRGHGGDKEKDGKVLEVPLRSAARSGNGPLLHCLRWMSRQKLVCPKDCSQVFIISDLGRPLAEEDVIDVGISAVIRENSDHSRRPCTTSHCLLLILIVFIVLALIAATLPWVFLA
ncbi:RING finger protein 222 [Clarias gariepinus]|uniref:RING finger protein 222 n=1 Tax=Clarias gariepinus TaxID=13013 RepID=UPI00234D3664|nr:RING finger protein 222 [Clarias gariepinus]